MAHGKIGGRSRLIWDFHVEKLDRLCLGRGSRRHNFWRNESGQRVSTFHRIESVNDISEFAEQLKEAVRERLGEG